MQESAQGFSSEERAMINRVLDLQTLTVRQVMKPLEQAVSITAQTPVDAALALCRERKHTRLPVWESRDGRKRIVGMLALSTLLYQPALDPARPVADYVKPALFLHEDLRLEVALRRLQRSGERLAIVLGRERREIGLLSLQDVLKIIFGEVSL
jgi:CBS domain containing-hemolysin-like protein